jgi:hypothetical protein
MYGEIGGPVHKTVTMSETEWTDVPVSTINGRVTAAKLGENSNTAVIRWKSRQSRKSRTQYRIIKVNYNLFENGFVFHLRPGLNPRARSICYVFGVENEFTLAEKSAPGVVVLLRRGRELRCETWALRSVCTVPPNGPRACATPDLCRAVGLGSVWKTSFDWGALPVNPKSNTEGIRWLRKRAKRVRILMMRRHDGVYAYRAIYWHSPNIGENVRVQGVLSRGKFVRVDTTTGLCVVRFPGLTLNVHRTCLAKETLLT